MPVEQKVKSVNITTMQSTTIHLSDDLYKKVKTLAVSTGEKLYEVIERLLQKGYDTEIDERNADGK